MRETQPLTHEGTLHLGICRQADPVPSLIAALSFPCCWFNAHSVTMTDCFHWTHSTTGSPLGRLSHILLGYLISFLVQSFFAAQEVLLSSLEGVAMQYYQNNNVLRDWIFCWILQPELIIHSEVTWDLRVLPYCVLSLFNLPFSETMHQLYLPWIFHVVNQANT